MPRRERLALAFACVGGGAVIANPSFQLSNHSRSKTISESFMAVMRAKKQSERVAGVGAKTTAFMISEANGVTTFKEEWVAEEEKLIADLEERHRDIDAALVGSFFTAAAPQSPPPSTDASPDQPLSPE